MCCLNVPDFALGNLNQQRSRWLILLATGIGSMVDEVAPTREAVREANANNGGSAVKRCVCSPTSHAGSFRCRLHFAEYAWRKKCAH
ncbi:uncharacterized protein J3R85_014844 [Psidium guajava]|nr:uncharacterized protein J3R85_014844 [Psidium guajava]